ncbi:MAG: hypothetical protein J6Y28_04440 [Acholeplasmatales bacterium]|nr:hypothetical protein [Methanobrevibacter sp.]MBP5445403.1 hypothetical protein [Acholeplasmatales bacterium]
MKIEIPYGENQYLEHYANVRVATNVEDNSSIPERMVPGLFTRLTLDLNIDDAYLWDIRDRNDVEIDSTVELRIQNSEADDFTIEYFKFKENENH